jgi:hypothetical protein
MEKLSKTQISKLAGHGVNVSEDTVTITTNGMAWLLNLKDERDIFAPMFQGSELRIRAFTLPVHPNYDDKPTSYIFFCFYLNGNPPPVISIQNDGVTEFRDEFRLNAREFGFDPAVFDVLVRFTEKEVATLKAGKIVTVKPT